MKKINIYLLLLISIGVISCSSEDTTTDTVSFDETEFLNNLVDNIIVPRYNNFSTDLDAFVSEIGTFTTTPSTANLTELRAKWKTAYISWQSASAFQFGPDEDNLLNGNMNIFPTNTTKIDNHITTGGFDMEIVSTDAKGFPAVDYLLYGIGSNDAEIVEKYTTDTHAANRIKYLSDIGTQMKSVMDETKNDWTSYATEFKTKTGTSTGSAISLFLNAYLKNYEDIKRLKFGIPSGVIAGSIDPLPEKCEAIYSGISMELAKANFNASLNYFKGVGENGADGVGIEELLIAEGQTELKNNIISAFSEAQAALNTVEDPLSEKISTNLADVKNIYNKLQGVVVYLKTEMMASLAILVTYDSGDGD